MEMDGSIYSLNSHISCLDYVNKESLSLDEFNITKYKYTKYSKHFNQSVEK